MNEKPLISIIVPVYNTEKYISETLNSILNQTYDNWECICIDDCSTDESRDIIEKFVIKDLRIKLLKLNKNSGAATARNTGIREARGDYLAFIDADDLWKREKLEIQLKFMINNNIIFSCTSYGKIDEKSNVLQKECIAKNIYSYSDLLKKCPGNSTIMYNCKKIGKIYGPDNGRREDFAMWLKVIKFAGLIHGLPNILSYHRIRKGSVSANKIKLIKYQWEIYFCVEKLGFIKSFYLMIYKIIQTLCNENG